MRVTLSYFIEPNPSERGFSARYRYESHGLRYDVKRPAESGADFRARIKRARGIEAVGAWIAERIAEGVVPHEIGIFVRSGEQLDRAKEAAQESGSPFKVLDEHVETTTGRLSVSTMHLAKGLEFRAVVVMACDDEVIPLQERIEAVADEADLQEVYDTERHLLYVGCTRARDYLLVTSVEPASEFFGDLREIVSPVR